MSAGWVAHGDPDQCAEFMTATGGRIETPRGAVIDNTGMSRFELLHQGDVVSHAVYRLEGERVIIPHVETIPSQRGNDFAAELMDGLLALVRRAGRTVTPLCSYAAGHIRDHPEHHDLLASP